MWTCHQVFSHKPLTSKTLSPKSATRCNVIVAAAVLLTTSSLASAATYHIRKDGNDTSCNGSANTSATSGPNCAFLTVQKGISAAQPGDTVSVHNGDYSSSNLTTARSGTASNRITIEAAAGETATIGKVTFSHDYITLRSFRITKSTGLGNGLLTINSGNVELRNNYIYSSSNSDYTQSVAILFGASSARAVVDGNTLDGTSASGAQGGPTMYVPINIHGAYHVISTNIIKNMVDCERVFETNGTNITISRNEIYNIFTSSQNSNGAHVDIFQNFFDTNASNYLIEGNYIHDIKGQLGNYESNGGTGLFIYRNNIFANIESALFIHTPHHHFYNNTFYRVGTVQAHAILEYPQGQSGGTNPGGAYDMEYKNNVFYSCGNGNTGGWYNLISKSTGSADYNYVATATNGAKSGFSEAHGINGGNPGFVAAYSNCMTNKCDFRLTSGSILIAKGATISSFSTDKDGKARSTPWDVGAYELDGGTAYTLDAPQGLRVLN